MKSIAVIFLITCQLLLTAANQCNVLSGHNGTIVEIWNKQIPYKYEKCWKISIPNKSFLRLTLVKPFATDCSRESLRISVDGTAEEYKLCNTDSNRNPVTVFTSVTVTHNITSNSYYNYYYSTDFKLEYKVQDIGCVTNDSFRCNEYSCIPKSQVCDGVKQCKDGRDEASCEIGIHVIDGVKDSRKNAVKWLLGKRTPSWGWGDNTHRAIVALFLADAANFNGAILEEELMAKQAELKTSAALLRSANTNNELSMFLNALLVTCHNPRHFFGIDLVKRLKAQVESANNSFIHPAAYLSLCNANETWPNNAISDLNSVLNSTSHYPFVIEIQAMAVLALSCFINRTPQLDSTAFEMYNETIDRFKSLQLEDGSFGNVYTTAVITQALIASGQEQSTDWKLKATIRYLMKELNSTSADFLMVSLTLPILNRKSLSNISNVNCTGNPRKHGYGIESELNDYLGKKMRVRYSLYIGDMKDVIHTISMRVPENLTAFEVMEAAELQDSKYSFKWKKTAGKTYVYEIAKITNDLEREKYWLQYLTSTQGALTHPIQSPDELVLKDEDHLIMWYKTASI